MDVITEQDVYDEIATAPKSRRRRFSRMRWSVTMLVDPFILTEAQIYAAQTQTGTAYKKYQRYNFDRLRKLLKRPVTKKQYWYVSRICILLCEYAMWRGVEDVYVGLLEERILKLEDKLKLLRPEVMSGKKLIEHYRKSTTDRMREALS